MTHRRRSLAALLLAALTLLLAGCATKNPDETSIPWSRPADWEGRIPGMGS